MKLLLLFFVVVTTRLSKVEGVVYYVSPTEQLGSCRGNSSCPPGQVCYTMDDLAESSYMFFSSDHINITLVFMCGIHNLTKNLTIQTLHSFVMKGETETKEKLIIDMFHQETVHVRPEFDAQSNHSSCTNIQFFNVSYVTITTLIMRCPLLHLEGGLLSIKNSLLNGHSSMNEVLSSITITSVSSKALLDNCVFKENCFVESDNGAEVTVVNSTFQSYSHNSSSMITAHSSLIRLTDNVNFTDSVVNYSCNGSAISLQTSHSGLKALLHVTADANVHFVNLTCNGNGGGAVHVLNGEVIIGSKATVVFKYNSASICGGAVSVSSGEFNIGTKATVVFTHNSANICGGAVFVSSKAGNFNISTKAIAVFEDNNAVTGGAVTVWNGLFNIGRSATVTFGGNIAINDGGAVSLLTGIVTVDADSVVIFTNNTAVLGGAMVIDFESMNINDYGAVNFSLNSALHRGGAIYIYAGVESIISVDKYANLGFYNNSAFQGGALYVIPSSYAIKVGLESSIEFANNTAVDVGGAIYAETQSAAPCLFVVTNYSAELSFIGNFAKKCIGQHIYGASVRYFRCGESYNTKGKPYCVNYSADLKLFKPINISFFPSYLSPSVLRSYACVPL